MSSKFPNATQLCLDALFMRCCEPKSKDCLPLPYQIALLRLIETLTTQEMCGFGEKGSTLKLSSTLLGLPNVECIMWFLICSNLIHKTFVL